MARLILYMELNACNLQIQADDYLLLTAYKSKDDTLLRMMVTCGNSTFMMETTDEYDISV